MFAVASDNKGSNQTNTGFKCKIISKYSAFRMTMAHLAFVSMAEYGAIP